MSNRIVLIFSATILLASLFGLGAASALVGYSYFRTEHAIIYRLTSCVKEVHI